MNQKVLLTILGVVVIAVGAWLIVGVLDNDADRDLLQEGSEIFNEEETQPENQLQGEEIQEVQIISSGNDAAYGKAVLDTRDQTKIEQAVQPAVVTADTQEQFDKAWDLLVDLPTKPEFNGQANNAVFIFMGLRTSSAYDMEFEQALRTSDGSLVLLVDTQEPKRKTLQREATSPYVVVSIPETAWEPRANTVITVLDRADQDFKVEQTWSNGLAQ